MAKSRSEQNYTEKNKALRGLPASIRDGEPEHVYADPIGSNNVKASDFARFWGKIASRYRNNSFVIFDLMNEPHSIPPKRWAEIANAAIKAIRETNASNLILVPGTNWTGAHSWDKKSWQNGTMEDANSDAMLSIVDQGNNFAFDVHQYLDQDYSGNSEVCISETAGSFNLEKMTDWLRKNNKRAFLGEFAGGRNDVCNMALDDMLGYLESNSDVWIGWTYWVAGKWWPQEYIFSVQPFNGTDRPQMNVLLRHI